MLLGYNNIINGIPNFAVLNNKSVKKSLPEQKPGLIAWFDPEENINTNGSNVSSWEDRSNANEVEQTTEVQQPIFDDVSSPKRITFDGTDDVLERNDNFGLTGNIGYTVFIIINFISLETTVKNMFWMGTLGLGTRMAFLKSNSSTLNRYSVGYGNGLVRFNTSPTAGQIQLATFSKPPNVNHNNTRLWVDGVESSISSGSSNSLSLGDTGTFIGAQGTTGANSINGDIGDVIIFSPNLSDNDIDDVNNFLKTKWSIA